MVVTLGGNLLLYFLIVSTISLLYLLIMEHKKREELEKKIRQLKESFTHKVDISDVDFEQFNTLPNTDIPPQIKKEFVSLCDYSRFATI
ncbi:hypothetical protein, partial [uncultured Methanomethylovorans sp.]|uniref:hypothetical protein n=1 Tax=uncultured Methanomethylovorans sp. TaxID=183759 RepID=UPI00263557BF